MLKSVILISGIMFATANAHAEETREFNLVAVCKKDCPAAKTDEDAHKCAEKMARLNKNFKKTKCWDVNEQYEAEQAKKGAE